MNLITLPKIELHCHLNGSLRPEKIIDIVNKERIEIRFMIQIQKKS